MFVYRIDENSQIRAQDGNFFDVDCTYTEKHGRYDKWEGLKDEKSTTRSERCAYRETIYRLAVKPIPRVVWPYHNNLAPQRRFSGFTQNALATDWKGNFMSQFDSRILEKSTQAIRMGSMGWSTATAFGMFRIRLKLLFTTNMTTLGTVTASAPGPGQRLSIPRKSCPRALHTV